jgi:hypothetical protein
LLRISFYPKKLLVRSLNTLYVGLAIASLQLGISGGCLSDHNAILYRARTGPEQGFPCVVILTGKNLFSLQETPLLIAGILYSLQGIPCENYYTGKSL